MNPQKDPTWHHAYHLHLTVGTHSARHIRRIVHTLCADWGVPPPLQDDIALGVTELLSNVVRHVPGSRAAVRLHHDAGTGRVRVEVTDEGPPFPRQLPPPADLFAASGRGLALVEAVTEKWGVELLLPAGKTVWFECAAPPPPPGP